MNKPSLTTTDMTEETRGLLGGKLPPDAVFQQKLSYYDRCLAMTVEWGHNGEMYRMRCDLLLELATPIGFAGNFGNQLVRNPSAWCQ